MHTLCSKFQLSEFERASSSSSVLPQQQRSTAPETLTKRQRQNAARREAQKADKATNEQERQARLDAHKKALERARIEEQFGAGAKGSKIGGGTVASVENSRLVWE